jgi:hypothetical protein
MVHGPAYEVSTVPAGTPVLSGPGQPLVVGEGLGVGEGEGLGVGVGLGLGELVIVGLGDGLVAVGDGVGEPVGLGLGLGLGHFGFGTHVGRMPTAWPALAYGAAPTKEAANATTAKTARRLSTSWRAGICLLGARCLPTRRLLQ